uniref:Cellobiose synthetase n=2 Tax=Rhizopus stolonifer TaxID=4846 RepID=A0A146B111_RHIST|nr:cellobiose synthetase [Rhizopus stolonifer]
MDLQPLSRPSPSSVFLCCATKLASLAYLCTRTTGSTRTLPCSSNGMSIPPCTAVFRHAGSLSSKRGRASYYVFSHYGVMISFSPCSVVRHQNHHHSKSQPRKRLLHGTDLPQVDILVPCCGEPVDVILDTVRAACTMDYPVSSFRVRVLDDGASTELETAVAALRTEWPHLFYHTRGRQSGKVFAKAGIMNYALFTLQEKAPPAFCAIFDADSIPMPHFLRPTLPHLLQTPEAVLLTTRQYFYNLPSGDPLSQSRLHIYTCENAELDRRGLAQDAGSGALFRRQAIIDSGGYPTYSFSEDWQLSLVLKGLGHRTIQVQQPLQFGLVPTSLDGHIAQRNRWHIGHSQQLSVCSCRPQTRHFPARCSGVLHRMASSSWLEALAVSFHLQWFHCFWHRAHSHRRQPGDPAAEQGGRVDRPRDPVGVAASVCHRVPEAAEVAECPLRAAEDLRDGEWHEPEGGDNLPVEQLLQDEFRVQYFRDYIAAMADAYTLDGVNVRAYMAWSLME